MAVVATIGVLVTQVWAQLAITEVMSLASGNPPAPERKSDYWELTNFGPDPILLTDYYFTDDDHEEAEGLARTGFPNVIEAGQSIVYVRNDIVQSEAEFREWWGSSISPNTIFAFYEDPGLSRYGDGLTLFFRTEIVDSVRFGTAKGGASFVYDTKTGEFGVDSVAGKDGAFVAETTGDVGSPGSTAGLVPLTIVSQPESIEIYPLLNTTLSVKATGLPRPRYQWFREGEILEGETKATLRLSNVVSGGTYYVQVSNGVTNVVSSNAVVTLSTTPIPPRIISAPRNATVLENKSARFTLIVESLPLASYQWFTNRVLLPNETNRSLLIQNCTLDMWDTEVKVRAENSIGWIDAVARLYVTTNLNLRITEVHASQKNDCAGYNDHEDWFELTNFGVTEVSLLGYRFSDIQSLKDAVEITEPISLSAGESMIFVKNSSVGSFKEWWGVENLPPDLKIQGYEGFSLRASGESLYLWSDGAETIEELVDSVNWSGSIEGTSQWFDDGRVDLHSVLGEQGAFAAVECADIGSPGYIANPPLSFTSVERRADGTRLKWRARGGMRYEISSSRSLAGPWTAMVEVTAANSIAEFVDTSSINSDTRFYRIQEIAP